MRKQLEQHRANPSCSGCHNAMDPLGFALENYDAVGAWRAKDGEMAIDSAAELPNGRKFAGAAELKEVLREQGGEFTQCLTEKLLTYALGRGLQRYDKPVVRQIGRQMAKSDYKFSALVDGIVTSLPFTMKRPQETR